MGNTTLARLLLVGAALVAACADADAPTPAHDRTRPVDPALIGTRVGPARDLGGTRNNPALAFRASGAALTAGYRTHAASIVGGVATLTPVMPVAGAPSVR